MLKRLAVAIRSSFLVHNLLTFFGAPIFAEEETWTRRARLLSFILNLHLIVALALGLIYTIVAPESRSYALIVFATCLPVLGLRLLMRRGHVALAAGLFLSLIALTLALTAWRLGGSVGTASMTAFQLVIVVMAGLLLGGRGALGLVVCLAIVNGMLLYAEANGLYGITDTRNLRVIWTVQLVTYSAVAVLLGLTNRVIQESLARAHRENDERRAAEAQLQRDAARLEILVEIDRAILNAQTLDSIALAVLQRMRLLVPARYAALVLFDFPRRRHEAFVVQTDHGIEIFREWRPFDYFEITEPLRQGQPQVVSDILALPQRTAMEEEMLNEGTRSYIDAPLVVQGELIGALSFEAVEVAAYDAERVKMIQQVADHLAIAVSSARLFEATRHQLDNLRVLQAVSVVAAEASDESDLINRVTEIIGLTASYSFGVLLVDEAAQVLRAHASYHQAAGELAAEPIPLGQGVIGWVAQHGQSRYLADIDQAPELMGEKPVTRSELAVPLKVGQRVIGVLNAESPQREAFTGDDERLLVTIAGQLATAIARLRSSAERETLIRDLEAKNIELERFTYTVSHDLKSPLITIRGFLGFMEQDAQAGNLHRLHADMERIGSATDKMHRLLNDLLELSRIGRLMSPAQAVSFEVIVHEALELVQGRLTARGVQVSVEPDLPIVFGDRTRLVEVVQNLVDNAAKFMGQQAEPRIEIGQQGHDADGRPLFFVRDNGLGIDAAYHSKVFGLFDKLDVHSEGTGVGLTLVKRIVEVHGGTIRVESTGLNQGSTFYFSLPTPH